MMPIVKVENLSKKYIIRHEHPERYLALRDIMAQKAKKIFSFPKYLRVAAQKTDYEEFWALKDLNFQINQGDRVGIIGRNGAGKSTLLKILSRITEPSTGRVILNGRVASLLEVGTGFHPELTGRENIYLNGAILGMSRVEIRRKFDEIVDFSGVEKFLDTPVKRYSSGMYVRLAFAVAAHLEPEILVVDEVLAVGDAEFQKKCLGKMEDVSKNEGRTLLFVSHNLSAIQSICNKGIYLRRGLMEDTSDIDTQVQRYLQDTSTITGATDHRLSKTLNFKNLYFSDNKVQSLKECKLNINLAVCDNDTILSFALIISASNGQRIAIIDYRNQIAGRKIKNGETIELSTTIESFPLIEGDYNVGFYYQGKNESINTYNLATFSVFPPDMINDIVPHEISSRGLVELKYSNFFNHTTTEF